MRPFKHQGFLLSRFLSCTALVLHLRQVFSSDLRADLSPDSGQLQARLTPAAMSSKTSSHSSSNRSSHARHRRYRTVPDKVWVFLHSFNLTLSVVSIAIFITIIPLWNANFFHSTGILRGDWPDGLIILPLSITVVASSNYLIILARSKRALSKPGDYLKSRQRAQVTSKASTTSLYITLATLILLLAFLILAGVSGLYRFWRPAVITSSIQLSSGTASSSVTLSTLSLRHVVRSTNSTPTNPTLTPPSDLPATQDSKTTFHSCTLANVFTRRCNPTLYLLGDLQIAALSTASLVWLLNLLILALQARDYQYQKRKHQRSLRSKARSKLDLIEDEMSRAEKGLPSTRKKVHYDRQRLHAKPSSTPSLAHTPVPAPRVTRPARAHTTANAVGEAQRTVPRPKQHYYDPNITPSRSRSTSDPLNSSNTTISNLTLLSGNNTPANSRDVSTTTQQRKEPIAYSRAVDEARRKVKPAETMRDWLAGRY